MSDWEGLCPDRPRLLRKILWNRGFRDTAEAEKFLQPRLQDIPLPHETLLDLREALQVLLAARESQDQIVVFGDYDVDGSTSTALLVRVLGELGFKVSYYIPHRVQEGYGLTAKSVAGLLKRYPQAKVVVTCDNGIGSFEGVTLLKQSGLKVIVTDHHEVPSDRVPADAVINPKQLQCRYPDKKLAGVGVAFLLLMGLRKALSASDYPLSRYLDLVAVGTVCDVAELTGVNRIITKFGLTRLKDSSSPGLRYLASRSPAFPKMKARDLGFFVGPRLNASGRVGEPDWGAKTLLAQSETEALPLVEALEKENHKRRVMQEVQVKDAEAKAASALEVSPSRQSLVMSDSDYHLGIVGLVASKISEKFQRPSCVLTRIVDEHELAMNPLAQGLWKGSLRAPVGYHLARALDWIRERSPGLLVSGGGHAQAAGVAIEEKNLQLFDQLFETAISQQIVSEVGMSADADLTDADRLDEVIHLMEPFGAGNPAPLLQVRGMKVERSSVMKEIHLKFWGQSLGRKWAVLQFQSPWVNMMADWVREGLEIDMLVELQENEWNGRRDIELLLKELVAVKVNGEGRNVIRARQLRKDAILSPKGLE